MPLLNVVFYLALNYMYDICYEHVLQAEEQVSESMSMSCSEISCCCFGKILICSRKCARWRREWKNCRTVVQVDLKGLSPLHGSEVPVSLTVLSPNVACASVCT